MKPGIFVAGFDPRRSPGGFSKRTLKLRKALAKRDARALEVLDECFADGDIKVRLEAAKLWAKYRLPVPTEKTDEAPPRQLPAISTAFALRLAELDTTGTQ